MSFPRLPLLIASLLVLPLLPAQTHPTTERHEADPARHVYRHERPLPPPPPSAYNGHPKLAIVLVLDGLPNNALERWRADFQKDRGFDLFLDHGAWFPDGYYDYANDESAPGDAAIATGAYTNGNGISGNSWWDMARDQKRPVSSVEDERYEMVGIPTGIPAPAAAPAAASPTTSGPATTSPGQPGATAAGNPSQAAAQPTGGAGAATAATPAQQPAAAGSAAPTANAQTSGRANGQANAGGAETTPAKKKTTKYVTGASPRNLLASTLGDELRLATQGQSRVYGIALKDSPAVLLAGAGANAAFWVDAKSGYWITSSFYMPTLPAWVDGFNNGDDLPQAEQQAGVQNLTNFDSQVGPTPAANEYELEFAEDLIQNEQLGQGNVTDMLTISLSANNPAGAPYAAGSPKEEQMLDALDTQLDGFFTWLDKNIPGGMGDVWVALTADHGTAPAPLTAAGYGLNAAQINLAKLVANLNLAINMKFSPGEKIAYVLPNQRLPYISLDASQFMKDGIDEQEAEQAVQAALPTAVRLLAPQGPEPTPSDEAGAGTGTKGPQPSDKRLPPTPVLFRSYTRTQLATGPLPPTPWGRLIANSYSPNGGWYVMVIPTAYQMAAGKGMEPFAPWSYGRHVPVGFWGAPFEPGTYLKQVQPVDIAPTFAALLGIDDPSAAVGKVLTEALKPADRVVYPRVVAHHEAAHPAGPAGHAPAGGAKKAAAAKAAPKTAIPKAATKPATKTATKPAAGTPQG